MVWFTRKTSWHGDCHVCGHDWREHLSEDGKQCECSECVYEIDHGAPEAPSAPCGLVPPAIEAAEPRVGGRGGWRKPGYGAPELFFAELARRVREASTAHVDQTAGIEPAAYGSVNVPWLSLSTPQATIRVCCPVMGELRIEIETGRISGGSEEYPVRARLDHPGIAEKEAGDLAPVILRLLEHPDSWRRVEDGYVFPLPPTGEFYFRE
ncbi:hypothetical protein ACX8Z9_14430 [Arthrobacter halodurans]|uniref:Uncharacterized protein n=1 Tax=Arthrobacter halodurans TaxID=516699 RepID=A0ABV4UPU2_9MICC